MNMAAARNLGHMLHKTGFRNIRVIEAIPSGAAHIECDTSSGVHMYVNTAEDGSAMVAQARQLWADARKAAVR